MTNLFQDFGETRPAQTGSQFQGFALLECLRSGPSEEVYRARQISSGRAVLLKILPAGTDPTRSEAWLAEVRRALPLRHESIVPVLDAGLHEGRLYYGVDFMGGGSIRDSLKSHGTLKEKHAILLAQGVALGLQYAWDQARLFHGHLRPESILLGSDGTVRVSDLGLGRVFCGRPGSPSGGLPFLPGQVGYASPELARGEADLDFRSDIYSLGAVLYHAVTGICPFEHLPEAQALEAHLRERLPDPQQLQPHLSPGISWLIEKMMIRDRSRRAASWSEVLADLMEVENGGLPYGEKPGSGESTVGRSVTRETQTLLRKPHPAAERKPPRVRVVLPAAARNRGSSFRQDNRVPSVVIIAMSLVAVAVVVWVYGQWIAPPRPPTARLEVRSAEWPPIAEPVLEPAGAEPEISQEEALRRLQAELAGVQDAVVPAGTDNGEPSLEPPGVREASGRPELFRRHPLFNKAARNFNAALALYRRFQSDPAQVGDLRQVEKLSEAAVVDFEALQAIYPGDARAIGKYVDQCYGMSRYARQSLLLSGAGLSDGTPPARPQPSPGIRPVPGRVPERKLSLAQDWRTGNRPSGPATTELYELLAPRGLPRVDLTPKPSIVLLGRIPYLERADEVAMRLFRRKLSEARLLGNPAFPNNSVRVTEGVGRFEDRFSTLQLLVDLEGKVIGLQMLDETESEEAWLPAAMFSPKWRLYDLLTLRSTTDPDALVAHRIRSAGGIVRIDTEQALPGVEGSGRMGRSLGRSSLLLPQPVVDLMLIRLGGSL